jgi:predicted porin
LSQLSNRLALLTHPRVRRNFGALSACAICALLGIARVSGAHADERIVLRLGGHYDAAAVAVSQGDGHGLRTEGIVSTGEIYIQGSTQLDNGFAFGFRAEFELERDNGINGDPDADLTAADDLIDEVWAYVDGGFGRIEMGQQDGVADQMMYFAPSVSHAIRINNPDIYMLECATDRFCSSGFGRPFAPNDIQLRTDPHVSDDNTKMVYYTPRFAGFQAGVSYTPELAKNFEGFIGRAKNETNQQSQIWEFGLNFGESFGALDIGFSAVYLTGENEMPVNFFGPGYEPGNVEEFGFGALAAYEHWSFGGSYRRTNVQGGIGISSDPFSYNVYANHHTSIWEAGVKYSDGPFTAGINFVQAETELPFSSQTQDAWAGEFAVGFLVGPGIHMSGGYQYYDFSGPNGACDIFSFCDTTNAGLFFIESALSF